MYATRKQPYQEGDPRRTRSIARHRNKASSTNQANPSRRPRTSVDLTSLSDIMRNTVTHLVTPKGRPLSGNTRTTPGVPAKDGNGVQTTAKVPLKDSEFKNRFKVNLFAVLSNEHPAPFSLADFRSYVEKEHSEENLEFWLAVMEYREDCAQLYPHSSNFRRRFGSSSSMRNSVQNLAKETSMLQIKSSDSPSSSLPEASLEESQQLLNALKKIEELYLTAQSPKEINLPNVIRKKVIAEIEEKSNLNPDIFKSCLEHIYAIMRTSTYPNFYKQAVLKCQQQGIPIPERLSKRQSSDQSNGKLHGSNSEVESNDALCK